MNQTWKIVIAVVITAIIVGGSAYWYQQNKIQPVSPPIINQITDKTFTGNGFSFLYPNTLTADAKGLWTAEGYTQHINPPRNCDACQIPEIEIQTTTTTNTAEQQILKDYDLPGQTLAETKQLAGITYENVKIGDNNFLKIKMAGQLNVTAYYTKHDNQVIAFKVYSNEKDNETLKKIISTLKFE
jgi:hypothetical protein